VLDIYSSPGLDPVCKEHTLSDLLNYNDPSGWLRLKRFLAACQLGADINVSAVTYMNHSCLSAVVESGRALSKVNPQLINSSTLEQLLTAHHPVLVKAALNLLAGSSSRSQSTLFQAGRRVPIIKQMITAANNVKHRRLCSQICQDSLNAIEVIRKHTSILRSNDLTVRGYVRLCYYTRLWAQAARQGKGFGQLPSHVVASHVFSFLDIGRPLPPDTVIALLENRRDWAELTNLKTPRASHE
jgi:hypothetical protein